MIALEIIVVSAAVGSIYCTLVELLDARRAGYSLRSVWYWLPLLPPLACLLTALVLRHLRGGAA